MSLERPLPGIADVGVDVHYGFDQGVDHAVEQPRAGGPVSRYTVKGILVYKRQKNGEFLVYRDIWNFNSAEAASILAVTRTCAAGRGSCASPPPGQW